MYLTSTYLSQKGIRETERIRIRRRSLISVPFREQSSPPDVILACYFHAMEVYQATLWRASLSIYTSIGCSICLSL